MQLGIRELSFLFAEAIINGQDDAVIDRIVVLSEERHQSDGEYQNASAIFEGLPCNGGHTQEQIDAGCVLAEAFSKAALEIFDEIDPDLSSDNCASKISVGEHLMGFIDDDLRTPENAKLLIEPCMPNLSALVLRSLPVPKGCH